MIWDVLGNTIITPIWQIKSLNSGLTDSVQQAADEGKF